ncbi:hypothetical protein VNO78_12638 [Psophocarpus tetragonolobus]|uniref:Uncharacterized protein n=1 Tax=Psophocarpus tetragonolobus TaxID=3891 RepID=A0AAN9SR29_PSOTE
MFGSDTPIYSEILELIIHLHSSSSSFECHRSGREEKGVQVLNLESLSNSELHNMWHLTIPIDSHTSESVKFVQSITLQACFISCLSYSEKKKLQLNNCCFGFYIQLRKKASTSTSCMKAFEVT